MSFAYSSLLGPKRKGSFIYIFLSICGCLYLMSYIKPSSINLFDTSEKWSYKSIYVTVKGTFDAHQIEEKVYNQFGFQTIKDGLIPQLGFRKQQTCQKIFNDWSTVSSTINEKADPPREIPANLLNDYVLNGYADLIKGYMDDRSGTKSSTWTKGLIDSYLARTGEQIGQPIYSGDGRAVFNSMAKYPIKGAKGFVIGSLSPWAEAMALKHGAAHVTTLEYMRISAQHPQIAYIHPVDLAKDYQNHVDKYDFAVSFSSIEHSGLGRFGDVLDPIGDFREMWKAHCMLKKGGYFFFALPVGYDTVHWNLHRIYGKMRLAMMFAGFEFLETYHHGEKTPITMKEEWFKAKADNKNHIQPVMVLRKL